MEKVLTHPAPHQRTPAVLIVLSVALALQNAVYDACCDSGVLCQFRRTPAHLH